MSKQILEEASAPQVMHESNAFFSDKTFPMFEVVYIHSGPDRGGMGVKIPLQALEGMVKFPYLAERLKDVLEQTVKNFDANLAEYKQAIEDSEKEDTNESA